MNASYLTVSNRLKVKGKEFFLLRDLTHSSKNLYNSGLYTLRQHFFETHEFLSYPKLYSSLKTSDVYRENHSQAGQQILKKVEQDMISFFGALKAKNSGENDRKVRLPKYKNKDGFFNLYLSKDCFKVEEDQVRISIPKWIQEKYDLRFLYVPLPKHIREKVIKQIELVPMNDGDWFKVFFTYLDDKEYKNVQINCKRDDDERVLGIDLGVNNFLAMINTVNDEAILVNGKRLKSANRNYNKELGRLKSIAKKENDKYLTKKICQITEDRNNFVKDQLHKISNKVINYCVKNGITEICIGLNKEWKQEINIGKRNNQNFCQLPHSKFISYLKYKAERHGIKLVETEESYTSKCDALNLEEITKHESYSGRRIKRGLFRSKTGCIINADINGALNIIRKCKGDTVDLWVYSLTSSGRVFRPQKWDFLGSGSLFL